MEKLHLISGLPRSGSTLLSAILNQNPRFRASISDPLLGTMKTVIEASTGAAGFKREVSSEQVKKMLGGLIEGYYSDYEDKVVFNTNRGWTANLHLIKDLYPDAKCIVCVREIGWIVDSFEQLYRRDPYKATNMFSRDESTVYARATGLLKADRVIGSAYNSIKQGLSSEHKKSLCLVDYDLFIAAPEAHMKAIYEFLEEPYFAHDFNNVESSYDEYDADFGMAGLHTTRKEVKAVPRETILPNDIWSNVKNMNFWRQPPPQATVTPEAAPIPEVAPKKASTKKAAK